METKNRMIRAEDALWTRVTKSASRLGRSASEFVRQSLWRATEDKLCFVCGSPAAVDLSARLGGWAEVESIGEMAARHASGDSSIKPYASVSVSFTACKEHEPGATDYFLDRDLDASGYALESGDSVVKRSRAEESDAAYAAMSGIISKFCGLTPRP